MKQFELHRFSTLLKWHLVANRREILNVFLELTIGFFVMLMFFTQMLGISAPQLPDADADWVYISRVHAAMGAGLFGIAVAMFSGAARIFHNMKSTRQRTSFLMLPASNPEKWLLRFLHATVLLFVITSLALVAADVVRMLIAPLWGKPFVSGVAWLLTGDGQETATETANGFGWLLFFLGSFVIMHHALFVLGGTLFRKQPFLLTCAVVFLLMMGMGHVAVWVKDAAEAQHLTILQYDTENGLVVHPVIWVTAIVQYLLGVLFYWLSYKVFCRMQVINNKWLNA